MTHDRVLRFDGVFTTPEQAARYATDQALAWIECPSRGPTLPTSTQD